MFTERQAEILPAKPNLSLEIFLNKHEIIVYNKTKSLKFENWFNVVSEKSIQPLTKLVSILSNSGH